MSDVVHWSDWSSQPEVRIACTQTYGFPWKIRKDLPDRVHEVPKKDGPSTLYTFEHHLVTCPDCLRLESFRKDRDARGSASSPPRCTCGEEGQDPPLPHKTWCQKAGLDDE